MHILTPAATVRRIVNITALTVVDANTQWQAQLLWVGRAAEPGASGKMRGPERWPSGLRQTLGSVPGFSGTLRWRPMRAAARVKRGGSRAADTKACVRGLQ